MSTVVSLGEWIALRRKRLDLTQRELAARANCALATIKKIEMDERRPSRDLAEALAGALQIRDGAREHFIECARGLRPVDTLDAIDDSGGAPQPDGSASVINLPLQSTPFIGRAEELDQIADCLADPACRLLTLIGAGGIGKTRLAYQAALANAGRFPSGVYAVPLAGVSHGDFLIPTITERLKLHLQSSDVQTQLFNFLSQKRLLLVLDNLEHLLSGVGLLADMLTAAPGVKILATSRERLNLSAEWLFPVGGLSFPSDPDEAGAETFNALQLFENGARRVLPDFHLRENLPAVVRICKLVDGMPLALELAASWVRRMSCEQIAEEVQRDLDFLAAGWRDLPERHRSIRALFEHSWRLLSPGEQAVMKNLSIFRGGFEREAAEQIAGAPLSTLLALEDKSLVQGSPSGHYDLHELIRQYAESQLIESGKAAEVRNKHLDYYLAWGETAGAHLHDGEQVIWIKRIKTEYNNLRAALNWAYHGAGAPEKGLRLANALWFFWFRVDGNCEEGFRWLELGLRQTDGVTEVRADALANAGNLAAQVGEFRTAIDYMKRAHEFSYQLDLKPGIARYIMGMNYQMGDYAQVTEQFESAIALLRESGPHYLLTTALFLFGDRARTHGDLDKAQALYDESLMLSRADQDLMMMLAILGRQGRIAALKGDYRKAQQFYEECGTLARQIDNTVAMMEHLIHMGALAIYLQEYDSAESLLEKSLVHCSELSNTGGVTHATYYLAELALHRQELTRAAILLIDSFNLTLAAPDWRLNITNMEFNCERLIIAGKLACAGGDYANGTWLLSAGEQVRVQSGYVLDPLPRAECEEAAAQARAHLGSDRFEALWQKGQAMSEEEAVHRAVAYLEARVGSTGRDE